MIRHIQTIVTALELSQFSAGAREYTARNSHSSTTVTSEAVRHSLSKHSIHLPTSTLIFPCYVAIFIVTFTGLLQRRLKLFCVCLKQEGITKSVILLFDETIKTRRKIQFSALHGHGMPTFDHERLSAPSQCHTQLSSKLAQQCKLLSETDKYLSKLMQHQLSYVLILSSENPSQEDKRTGPYDPPPPKKK